MSPLRRAPLWTPASLLRAGLVTGLLLGGFVVAPELGPAFVAPAWAADAVFEGPALLELLRPSDLVGDGASPAELRVLALSADGQPLAGMKSKLIVEGGTATDLVDAGGGFYTFNFTPERVQSATSASITLKAKLATKESVNRTWTVPISPPRTHALTVAASPAQLTLGVDKTASASFVVAGGDVRALAGIDLSQRVSVGTMANLTNLGGGQFNGLYTPPTGMVPQVALITAVDRGDPTRTYGSVAIPLPAKFEQAVTVAPNSSVVLKIGGRDFGPVTADAKGRAKLPVVIPPGVTSASRVQVTPDGAISEAPLDLALPEVRRIALFPTAPSLPADGRVQIPVRALVVTPDGRPDEAAQLLFSASAGSFSAPRHEGGGVYVASYTPPYANTAGSVALKVQISDRPPVQTDTLTVPLVPTRPSRLSLSAEPTMLPKDATGFAVMATVAGPDGAGLSGRGVAFSVNGAKLQEVKDLKNGAYRATFTTTGKGPVELSARVSSPATQNPLAHVVLVPSRSQLPPDGLSSAMFTVATVDELGYPVANVDVALKVVSGDGSLPEYTTTDAAGLSQIYYTAGRTVGFVGIEASAFDRGAGASLVQVPPEVTIPPLPVTGSAATRAMVDELGLGMAALRLERGQ